MGSSAAMSREALLRIFDLYAERHPEERAVARAFRALVGATPRCFERDCLPGHVTGSAWIVSPDGASVLLTHHRKLGRWLQLGGHADGEEDPLRVTLREAREESGMQRFEVIFEDETRLPLDLDVHEIPVRGEDPAHLHYDVRYLLRAGPNQPLLRSDESHDLCWAPRAELRRFTDEESQLRMERKARALLEGRGFLSRTDA
jgi:8-oxo-dGTP pyrophosphatase MutT (NUDIX family)